jgi:hypothetical protein
VSSSARFCDGIQSESAAEQSAAGAWLDRHEGARSTRSRAAVCLFAEDAPVGGTGVSWLAGRDHWGPANCILLAGGGIRGGHVVGATNPKGEKPASDPRSPEDLTATMCHCLGIDPDHEFYTPEGRPVKVVNGGKVIGDLLA